VRCTGILLFISLLFFSSSVPLYANVRVYDYYEMYFDLNMKMLVIVGFLWPVRKKSLSRFM